jgi:hypothetical protein
MENKLLGLSAEERLALGKRIHEREWGDMASACKELGTYKSNVYALQREYRASIGALPEDAPKDPAQRRKELDAKRHRQRREAVKASPPPAANGSGSNGSGRALVPAPAQDAARYSAKIASLEAELDTAHDEIRTLQKILMTVGRSL